MMGGDLESNEELEDAPESTHVKRTAQESYDPEAFMLRRSMPWAKAHAQGLEFVAFGELLDRYERVLHRMLGLDDGLVDGACSSFRGRSPAAITGVRRSPVDVSNCA